MTVRFAAAALLVTVLTAPAGAGVRNFFTPEIGGARVDACLGAGDCGKAAADAFCKAQGYDRATIFQRERSAMSRVLDTGQLCSGGSCTAFRQVGCFTTKSDLAALGP